MEGQDWEQICETAATVSFDENNDLNVDHEEEDVHETFNVASLKRFVKFVDNEDGSVCFQWMRQSGMTRTRSTA
jgi:hypothetical protein